MLNKFWSVFFIVMLITACSSGSTPATGQNVPGVTTNLPPMPDRAANNATLAGIDTTGTGVRDDVYRWVFQNYTSTHKRNALVQQAQAFRKIYLTPPQTTSDALVLAKDMHRSAGCIYSYVKAGYLTLKEADIFSRQLEAMHADTDLRMQAYDNYNALLDGTGSPLAPTAGCCDAGGGL
jgi:hypothetical protein